MARAVPLLPCGSLDEAVEFYGALGFEVVVRQERPNPYAALRRDDLDLHVYGMPDWDPSGRTRRAWSWWTTRRRCGSSGRRGSASATAGCRSRGSRG